jgi:hypothetical protein
LRGDINDFLTEKTFKAAAQLRHVELNLGAILYVGPDFDEFIFDELTLINPHAANTSRLKGRSAEALSQFNLEIGDIMGGNTSPSGNLSGSNMR